MLLLKEMDVTIYCYFDNADEPYYEFNQDSLDSYFNQDSLDSCLNHALRDFSVSFNNMDEIDEILEIIDKEWRRGRTHTHGIVFDKGDYIIYDDIDDGLALTKERWLKYFHIVKLHMTAVSLWGKNISESVLDDIKNQRV